MIHHEMDTPRKGLTKRTHTYTWHSGVSVDYVCTSCVRIVPDLASGCLGCNDKAARDEAGKQRIRELGERKKAEKIANEKAVWAAATTRKE